MMVPASVTCDASSTVSGIDDRAVLSIVVGAIKDLYAKVQEYFAHDRAAAGARERARSPARRISSRRRPCK